jgi:hypothetical protein
MTNVQLFLSIGVPTIAVLISFLLNNARLNSIETNLGNRITSVETNVTSRISSVESRLTAIEGDLRQFYRDLGNHEAEIGNLKSQRRA